VAEVAQRVCEKKQRYFRDVYLGNNEAEKKYITMSPKP